MVSDMGKTRIITCSNGNCRDLDIAKNAVSAAPGAYLLVGVRKTRLEVNLIGIRPYSSLRNRLARPFPTARCIYRS